MKEKRQILRFEELSMEEVPRVSGRNASLSNDHAIAYQVGQGFDQRSAAISAGIHRMVRSDLAGDRQ